VPPTEEPKGNGKIELGGEEEAMLRDAARLARNVREFAGSLVKVCRLTIDNCEVDGVFFSSSR
jgi:hypothetical protein